MLSVRDCQDMHDFLAQKGIAAPQKPQELESLARERGYSRPNLGDDPKYMATVLGEGLPGWWGCGLALLALIAIYMATL